MKRRCCSLRFFSPSWFLIVFRWFFFVERTPLHYRIHGSPHPLLAYHFIFLFFLSIHFYPVEYLLLYETKRRSLVVKSSKWVERRTEIVTSGANQPNLYHTNFDWDFNKIVAQSNNCKLGHWCVCYFRQSHQISYLFFPKIKLNAAFKQQFWLSASFHSYYQIKIYIFDALTSCHMYFIALY